MISHFLTIETFDNSVPPESHTAGYLAAATAITASAGCQVCGLGCTFGAEPLAQDTTPKGLVWSEESLSHISQATKHAKTADFPF